MSSEIIELVYDAFASAGAAEYLGEPVTLRAHMLQTAVAAERAGAPAELVVAALLHDYGHLICDTPEHAAESGLDTEHEEVAYRFLATHFPSAVVEPIRLHVAAKRYLCAVDPAYHDLLSPASQLSLGLQGGPMSAEEAAAFEAQPHFRTACLLRRYDDAAKDPDAVTPPLSHYRRMLETVLTSQDERVR